MTVCQVRLYYDHVRIYRLHCDTAGCDTDDDCPSGYSCSLRKCRIGPGKVLLESFTVKTLNCTGCSQENEGIKVTLQGERTGEFSSGNPCNTSAELPLDHQNVEDFRAGGVARFDGSSTIEKNMMGDCFKVRLGIFMLKWIMNTKYMQAPLNAMVRGGSLIWVGQGVWTPSYICVDWQSSNYAYQCQVKKVARRENFWQISDCKEDYPRQKCGDGE